MLGVLALGSYNLISSRLIPRPALQLSQSHPRWDSNSAISVCTPWYSSSRSPSRSPSSIKREMTIGHPFGPSPPTFLLFHTLQGSLLSHQFLHLSQLQMPSYQQTSCQPAHKDNLARQFCHHRPSQHHRHSLFPGCALLSCSKLQLPHSTSRQARLTHPPLHQLIRPTPSSPAST